MPQTILKVEQLSLFDNATHTTLVESVNFQMQTNQIVCLVGASGSGKSLTALSLLGLLPPNISISQGSIQILGRTVPKNDESTWQSLRQKNIAAIFQDPLTAWNPLYTIGQQMDEVLRIHTSLPKPERSRKILQQLEEVELLPAQSFYAAYPHKLSGGQRQRALIGMALLLQPDILIADEPTSALDASTQWAILQLLERLQQEKVMSILLITHDFSIVKKLADYVLVMQNGRLIEEGTVQQLYSDPQTPFLQELLSRPSYPNACSTDSQTAASPPLLSVQQIAYRYPTRQKIWQKDRSVAAIEDINLELARGEILAIVGESGSGKSTLARCMAQRLFPSQGAMYFNNTKIQDAHHQWHQKVIPNIQMIFQDPYSSFNPYLTLAESLTEGLSYLPSAHQDSMQPSAEDLLELVELPRHLAARHPHQLSGGQCQRAAIARALAVHPLLLIADEAVSALDSVSQQQIIQLLQKQCHDRQMGLIFITHDLQIAAQISHRLLVLKEGRVVEYGSTADIMSNPQDFYTQNLLKYLNNIL